jgi:zinc D-Ala-D-Ala carboxypeptidase
MPFRSAIAELYHPVAYAADTWPADKWPNFSFEEMACSETGECEMVKATMDRLQLLRDHYGLPLTITSGYRSPRHSIEAAKAAPGTHSMGRAVDIACAGVDAFEILTEALVVGFTGIGVQQKGEHRFLHLDDLKLGEHTVPRPTIWSY